MDTFSVYLMKLMPDPSMIHQKNNLKSKDDAKNYIRNPSVNTAGNFWIIVRIPSAGNVYELIEFIPI